MRPATELDPAQLIRDYQAGVWRYLRVLGCEPALADDLTQDTFLAILQGPFEYVNPAATAVYLRRIAGNLYFSHLRRAGRFVTTENIEQMDQAWQQCGGDSGGEELLDALRECLQGLTARARQSLDLRFGKQATREAIANELGISEHGAKNLMQRAKQQLRTCIEAKLADDK